MTKPRREARWPGCFIGRSERCHVKLTDEDCAVLAHIEACIGRYGPGKASYYPYIRHQAHIGRLIAAGHIRRWSTQPGCMTVALTGTVPDELKRRVAASGLRVCLFANRAAGQI